jgi:hypothetical protein
MRDPRPPLRPDRGSPLGRLLLGLDLRRRELRPEHGIVSARKLYCEAAGDRHGSRQRNRRDLEGRPAG